MRSKINLILILVFAASILQYAQQGIADSLEKQLGKLSGEKKVDVLDELADIYHYMDNKKALDYANRGLRLADSIKYYKGMASCLGSIGHCNINLDNEKALEYTKKALAIRKQINDKAGISNSLNVLGIINYYKGDYLASIENHLKALKIREEIGNTNKIAISYNNISLIYIALEDYDTALQYLNKALTLRKKAKIKTGYALIEENIGDIYYRMGKYDLAVKHLDIALKQSALSNNKQSEAGIYLIFAKIYIRKQEYKAALKCYNMAYEIYKAMNEKHGVAQSEIGIASIYQEEGKSDLALNQALLAMEVSDSINSLDNIANAANIIQAEYYKKGDIKKAYHYLKIFKDASDSLKITDKIKKVAKEEFDYKIQEIKEKQDTEIAKQKIFIQWLTITLVLGSIIVILIIFVSINNRKVNKQLSKLNVKLQELNATKDRFFSIIAHDLRSPFHSLLAFSDALSNDIDNLSNEEIKEFNTNINNSLKKQFGLLNDLLNWSRLQNENFKLELSSIQLSDELNSIIETLSISASQKNINLINEVDKKVLVNADKNMLQLVIRNIISNSIKFSNKQGFVKISSEQNDGFVKINVSDNGVGIPNSDLDKIFKIDMHYSTTGTAEEKGTGLGLILCKEIVEKHGGEISIYSEEGKGTEVSFTLKAA